jgi:hypothetical protein
MPSVAASERGQAQTRLVSVACRRCQTGVGRTRWRGRQPPRCSRGRSRRPLERVAIAGESPVGDAAAGGVNALREYGPTREIGPEAGRTTVQGSIHPATDSEPVP